MRAVTVCARGITWHVAEPWGPRIKHVEAVCCWTSYSSAGMKSNCQGQVGDCQHSGSKSPGLLQSCLTPESFSSGGIERILLSP